MKRIAVYLIFFLLTTTFLRSQIIELELYLLSEGIENATAKAAETLNNPVLVNAITANIVYKIPVPGVELEYQGVLSYEGDDIGKANFWIYFFSEKDNPTKTAIILTAKVKIFGTFMSFNAEDFADFSDGNADEILPLLPVLSYSRPIDLNNIIDSDKFVKAIVENADYEAIQAKFEGNDQHISIVGLFSTNSDFLGLEAEQTYWARLIFDAASSDTICCATPFNDLTKLYCAEFSEQEPEMVLGYFLLSEGFESAIEEAKQHLTEPILISIYSGNFPDKIAILGEFQGKVFLEGDDIGKANFWIYVFKEKENPIEITYIISTKVIQSEQENIIASQTFDATFNYDIISISNEIEIDKIIDSDKFVQALTQNSNFDAMKAALEVDDFVMQLIGIFSYNVDYFCVDNNNINWMQMIANKYEMLFCCSAPFDDLTFLTCEDYISIEEEPTKLAITIFPNPASSYLMFSNFEELEISSIEIFDIAGNLISAHNPISTSIDISQLASGSYFICFTVNNQKVYRSFIRE